MVGTSNYLEGYLSEITALRAIEAGALDYLLLLPSVRYSLRSMDKNGRCFAISTRFNGSHVDAKIAPTREPSGSSSRNQQFSPTPLAAASGYIRAQHSRSPNRIRR